MFSKLLICASLLGIMVSTAVVKSPGGQIPILGVANQKSGTGYGCYCEDCTGTDGCNVGTNYCYITYYPLLTCCGSWLNGDDLTCKPGSSGYNPITSKCWKKVCYATYRCGDPANELATTYGPTTNGCG